MAYDIDSRRTTLMLGNGSTRKYAYNPRGELTTQVELNASSTPVVTLIDTYDAVGNRLSRSVNGTVATWSYDDLYRMFGHASPTRWANYPLKRVAVAARPWIA